MGLGRQWDERLKIWDHAFAPNLYQKVGMVQLEGFTTMEQISRAQAESGNFIPFGEGSRWGRKWEYGWFRSRVVLPQETAGKRVLLHLSVAPEMLVYVNGREAGSIDQQHDYVQLTPAASAGESFEIYAEAYAGHGPRPEGGGIYPRDAVSVLEPPEFQCIVGESSFGIWNEEMFQAYADYHTLYELWRVLPESSLRGMQVAQALKEFTYQADFELPEPLRTESVKQAREVLKPLLGAKNGTSAPLFSVFGQSHLDLAWLWTNEETKRKSARTYANQVALMERYPEYQFLLCEPPILENLKNYYPDLYQRVKEKAKEGNFIPDGAMWVEGDTNMAGGESLIRQFVYGKKWFREEFGVDSRVAWMPDTFGYTGALPQIMKGCGVEYFATQKLLRADPESEPFPYNLFWWEGIDGSRILSHIFKEGNAVLSPAGMVQRWENDRNQKEEISGMLYPFGYGDGGGGPTEIMVEMLRRCGDLEGAPRTVMEGPEDYFRRASGQAVENVYYGELYLAWHRGTYTTQARVKKKVRQAEAALRQAEFLAGLLRLEGKEMKGYEPERAGQRGVAQTKRSVEREAGQGIPARLEELWKELLFCEFHDILPGTSIRRVNEEAEAALDAVRRESLALADGFLAELAGEGAVFNSLSWPRKYGGISIPPCGYVRVGKREDSGECEQVSRGSCAASRSKNGQMAGIVSVEDRQQGIFAVSENEKESVFPAMPKDSEKESVFPAMSKDVENRAVAVVSADASDLIGHGEPEIYAMSDNRGRTVTIENKYYRAKVDCLGRILSLRDKETGYEYAAGALNELCMYRDVNIGYDAWEIGRMYEQVPVELGGEAMLKICWKPDGIHLGIYREEAHFTWQQEIVFLADSCKIEFRTKVDWRERHKLLKVAFPTTVHTREAIEEIQFGYLKRPTHRSRRYERDLYETCHHRYAALSDGKNGLAVLNNCKYGISAKDSTLALTLLRAPVIPDMEADQGEHEFTYALYLFEGPFTQSDVVREAYELNIPVTVFGAGKVSESHTKGAEEIGSLTGKIHSRNYTKSVSYFNTDCSNIIIETCKPAMNEQNGVILRLYECMGSAVGCKLSLPHNLKGVWLCNMLEERQEEVPCSGGVVELHFHSFEIKTLLLMV